MRLRTSRAERGVEQLGVDLQAEALEHEAAIGAQIDLVVGRQAATNSVADQHRAAGVEVRAPADGVAAEPVAEDQVEDVPLVPVGGTDDAAAERAQVLVRACRTATRTAARSARGGSTPPAPYDSASRRTSRSSGLGIYRVSSDGQVAEIASARIAAGNRSARAPGRGSAWCRRPASPATSSANHRAPGRSSRRRGAAAAGWASA